MIFHFFKSQEERQKFGRSYFIEFQYCRLAFGTNLENIISVDAVKHWRSDSLYLYGDEDVAFFSAYSKIFQNGIYANGQRGVVDLCGINYYPPEEATVILKAIQKGNLPDWETLMNWLEKAKAYNGFYILGL